MSDFLNQFTKENYDRSKMKITDQELKEETVKADDKIIQDKVNEESNEIKAKIKNKPKLKKYNGDEQSYVRDEVSEIDPEYKKEQSHKVLTLWER